MDVTQNAKIIVPANIQTENKNGRGHDGRI